MPNWIFVKRQLKFYKPRYLFTKTHKPKMKTHVLRLNNALFIYLIEKHYHDMKQLPELLTSTFLAGHKTYGVI